MSAVAPLDEISKPIRVMLVDDHPVMIDGLRSRLENRAGMKVCAVATNGAQLLALYPRELPDVVLCDVSLPGQEDGISITESLVHAHPEAVVLMYSAYTEASIASSAVEHGAVGFVLKSTSVNNLVECVTAARAGERDIFDRVTATTLLREARKERQPVRAVNGVPLSLTPRQLEILTLMAETGETSSANIARQLHMSEATVKTHINRLFNALGVNTRGAAISLAYQLKLVASEHSPSYRIA